MGTAFTAGILTAVGLFGGNVLLPGDILAATPVPVQSVVSVTVTPQDPLFNQPVTVDVAWCIPNGSRAGDTVTLGMPTALRPLAGSFSVTDAQGNEVASASVADNAVTLAATGYVAIHSGVCGRMTFAASIVFTAITVNQPNRIIFTSGDLHFPSTITPIERVGASASQPLIYGAWTNPSDQGRAFPADALTWYVESPQASALSGFARVVFTARAAAGQQFDCAALEVEIGTLDQFEHYLYRHRYAGRVNVVCKASAVAVTTGPVPAGSVVRLVALATISSPTLAPIVGSGAVAIDGGEPIRIFAIPVVHYYASATASGSPSAGAVTGSARTRIQSAASGKHSGLTGLLVGGIAFALVMICAGALSRGSRGWQEGTG
ncbi:MAG: Ig-like domain-containing protein [Actinomycetota bacterium]|nr:Ig-like domain-containing protein [Actinomycetota bacterium]